MKSDLSNFSREELWAALAIGGVRTDSGCLLWLGSRRPNGYGLTRARNVTLSAHRVACFLKHGAPAPGQDACHTCDVEACIEGDHLFWGSRSENMRDASRKRRLHSQRYGMPEGHAHPRAILSSEALHKIVFTDTRPVDIEREFGYDASNVVAIRNGRLWRTTVEALKRSALSTEDSNG